MTMTNRVQTLNDFFAGNGGLVLGARPDLDTQQTIKNLHISLEQKLKGLQWSLAREEICSHIQALLQVDLAGILARAWKTYSELLNYTDTQRYPPERSYLVALAEHEVKSRHKPALEILVNGEVLGKIPFQVDLVLVLKGVVLKIQAGRIKTARTGSCQARGSLKCENLLLLEKKTQVIELPGLIDLGEGVAIGPAG